MLKILHAADLHLDSAFASLPPDLAALRRREQRQALEQLAQEAQGCDLVLLSGDLFDGAHVYRDTLDALKACFSAMNTEIFIAPGNHDPFTLGSPYAMEDWGERVHIFQKPAVECVHLENVDVYGAGFVSAQQEGLLRHFRVENPDKCSVMVLHGDVGESVYCPIAPVEIAASRLDYLALGHVHTMSVAKAGRTTYAYPGCIMGRGFDECGQKGVLRVSIDGDCRTEFVPIFTRRYEILTVTPEELEASIPENVQEHCYRIVLTGESDPIDMETLERKLSPCFFSLSLRDETYPRADLWAAAGEDTLRGSFLKEMKRRYDAASDEERRRIARAAKLVVSMMDGREVTL